MTTTVDPLLTYSPDDDQIAQELREHFQQRFSFFRGMWHEYIDGVWQALEEIEMMGRIREHMRLMRQRDVELSMARLNSAEKMYRIDCFVRQERIGGDDQYLNMLNGMLNLNTFLLERHRADSYFTWQLPYSYNAHADCPTFKRFLRDALVDEAGNPDLQLQALMQEAIGYTLTADTSRKVSFWLYGRPDAGKSTFLNLLADLLGNMHVSTDLNKLANDNYMMYRIADKRAVTCTEADTGTMLADGIYKTLVGGVDRIVANIKFKDPIEFTPKCKLWWAMNQPPRISDRSGAVMRRIIPIPFFRSVPRHLQDPLLPEKLRGELTGILGWALAGLQRLRDADHFTRSQTSDNMRESIRLANDTELAFVNDMMERGADFEISSKQLNSMYSTWCVENNFGRKNANQLALEWERLGFQKVHRSNGNYWIGLRPDAQKGRVIDLSKL